MRGMREGSILAKVGLCLLHKTSDLMIHKLRKPSKNRHQNNLKIDKDTFLITTHPTKILFPSILPTPPYP